MYHHGVQLSVALYEHRRFVRRVLLYPLAAADVWLLVSLEKCGSIMIGTHTLIPEAKLGTTLKELDLVVQDWQAAGHVADVRRIAAFHEREPT